MSAKHKLNVNMFIIGLIGSRPKSVESVELIKLQICVKYIYGPVLEQSS